MALIAILHVIFIVALVALVLVQDSKGGALGAFGGGGGTSSVFGASGGANFLVKATTVVAILFAATCLTLTYKTSSKQSSVVDSVISTPTEGMDTAPTAPAKEEKPAAEETKESN